MKLPSGVKHLRAVDQLLDARRLERRHAGQRLLHQLLEMVPVGIEQGEVEAVGDAVFGAQGIGLGS